MEEETTEEEDEAALGQGGEEQMEVKVGAYMAVARSCGPRLRNKGGKRRALTQADQQPQQRFQTHSWGAAPSSGCRRWRPRWWCTSAPASSTTSACPSTTRWVRPSVDMCTMCIHDIGGGLPPCLPACLPARRALPWAVGRFRTKEGGRSLTHPEPQLTLPHTQQQYKESEMGQLSGWHASSVGEETETPEVRDVTSTPQVGMGVYVAKYQEVHTRGTMEPGAGWS